MTDRGDAPRLWGRTYRAWQGFAALAAAVFLGCGGLLLTVLPQPPEPVPAYQIAVGVGQQLGGSAMAYEAGAADVLRTGYQVRDSRQISADLTVREFEHPGAAANDEGYFTLRSEGVEVCLVLEFDGYDYDDGFRIDDGPCAYEY